ncbi:hypothetical protein [Streptomyces triculaminicus]|uniref:hypothetical protein n=1 Tax=Streptomyces triculaminicus TaxID=2816232 RepID=UPI0037A51C64
MKATAIAIALARGSWALGRGALDRAWVWCKAGEGSNKVWRGLALLVGTGAAYRLTGSSPAVAGGVALAALGIAWMRHPELLPAMHQPEADPRAGHVDAIEGTHENPEGPPVADTAEPATTASQTPDPMVSLETFSALVRELAQGGAGAHLSALAERLTGDPKDTSVVRSLCREWGVPVSPSVRQPGAPGRGVSTGVKVTDLPPLLSSPVIAPEVAVVVAGQEATTGPATATATPVVEQHAGGALTTIYDGTHRTTII